MLDWRREDARAGPRDKPALDFGNSILVSIATTTVNESGVVVRLEPLQGSPRTFRDPWRAYTDQPYPWPLVESPSSPARVSATHRPGGPEGRGRKGGCLCSPSSQSPHLASAMASYPPARPSPRDRVHPLSSGPKVNRPPGKRCPDTTGAVTPPCPTPQSTMAGSKGNGTKRSGTEAMAIPTELISSPVTPRFHATHHKRLSRDVRCSDPSALCRKARSESVPLHCDAPTPSGVLDAHFDPGRLPLHSNAPA